MENQKRILIAGVPEKQQYLFRKILDKNGYFCSFSDIENCKLSDSALNQQIIIAILNNESELSSPAFDTLKAIAEREKIPFFVITGINSKKTYLALVGKGICNIISSPVMGHVFKRVEHTPKKNNRKSNPY